MKIFCDFSVFYLDETLPKGTVIEEVGRALVRGGYKIKVLNTIDFSCSMHYNPFVYLHRETDVLTLVTVKTHIINYAKTRDTYATYRRTRAADKPAFRAVHEAEILLHEAAKRAFDAKGVKKLPTVKVLQAEYTVLLTKKKAAYEDYKRLRQENHELQAVKSNVDSLLQIQQEEKKEQKKEQEKKR